MADIRAAVAGDVAVASNWVGGVVPGTGDIAYANGQTMTVAGVFNVGALSNASGTSITVGGTFSLLNNANVTCINAAGILQGATVTPCVTTPTLGLGQGATIAANYTNTGTLLMTAGACQHGGAGTLTHTGSVVAGSVNSCYGIQNSGTGTLNLNGSWTAGSNSSCYAVANTGAGTINSTGVATGSTGTTTAGLWNSGTGTINHVGPYSGGSNVSSYGALNASSGTMTLIGTGTSGTFGAAIGPGSAIQVTRASGPFLLGPANNINPVQAQSWRRDSALTPSYYEVPNSTVTGKAPFYSANNYPSNGYPAQGNVRSQTVYGPNNEFTGTCAVPAASSVAAGTPVDGGVGTAILTGASVRGAVGLASANLDTQLAPLTSYSPAPSASDIATAVWTRTSRPITNIADIVSAVWAATVKTITGGTVDSLTNAPAVPSAAENADAVRVELEVELERLRNCATVQTTANAIMDSVS